MKKITGIVSALIMAAFILTGCDKVNDLNTVNFDADFTGDLNCTTVGASSRIAPAFGASFVIEPTSDPNVNLYLNNIQKYDIQSIKGTVTSISQPNVTVVSAYLIIKNFQYTAEWDFENELLNVGTTLTLGNENGQWDTVSEILKDGQEITVLITGESDFSGVTFTIKVDIVTKASANII